MNKTMPENDLLLRALRQEVTERRPVWVMRQAGRYLPEYREVRKKAGSFMNLCRNTEMACEVSLQPIRRYPLDAVIMFSDILTIPDAMGLDLWFADGEGPQFRKPLRNEKDIASLPQLDTDAQLSYVPAVIKEIKIQLSNKLPLLGFSGSPWTLATYMVSKDAGRSGKGLKAMVFAEPETVQQLLERLTDAVSEYLCAQIRAGVDAVQIFDSWGGMLPHATYSEFSLQYIERVIKNVHKQYPGFPVILYTKGGSPWLEAQSQSGAHALSVDWTCSLAKTRKITDCKVALQGNLDPTILLTDPDTIRYQTIRMLEDFGVEPGHIANLGHGITPDVPPEHLAVFIETVQSFNLG